MTTSGHITPAGTNVLDELDLDPALIAKSLTGDPHPQVDRRNGPTQRQAAALMPVSQPKLSLIIRGKLDDISQAKLEECLQALGHDIEIRIGAKHNGRGQLIVLESA